MNWIKKGGKWVVKLNTTHQLFMVVFICQMHMTFKVRRYEIFITNFIHMVPGALLSETSEQYTYRAEFFFGDLNEGRDYERCQSPKYGVFRLPSGK